MSELSSEDARSSMKSGLRSLPSAIWNYVLDSLDYTDWQDQVIMMCLRAGLVLAGCTVFMVVLCMEYRTHLLEFSPNVSGAGLIIALACAIGDENMNEACASSHARQKTSVKKLFEMAIIAVAAYVPFVGQIILAVTF